MLNSTYTTERCGKADFPFGMGKFKISPIYEKFIR